ncbi:transposase [Apilactobacillus micheneri]|nr:transposase [Apilactobacillus micheneri]TPR50698.1 transposase [Apilactobacillus micheneri]
MYGNRRITAYLNNNGKHVNHKCVKIIMQKYSLRCNPFSKTI